MLLSLLFTSHYTQKCQKCVKLIWELWACLSSLVSLPAPRCQPAQSVQTRSVCQLPKPVCNILSLSMSREQAAATGGQPGRQCSPTPQEPLLHRPGRNDRKVVCNHHGHKLKHKEFHLNGRKNFFTHWGRQSSEQTAQGRSLSLPLETFQTHLEVFLCHLLYMTLAWQG